MLKIHNLHVSIQETKILKGVELNVGAGEVHAVMGPNGSGKSTLAHLLAGKPGYQVTSGEILFQGQDLLGLAPEERARAGLFLSFQHPLDIPGVRLDQFLRAGVNAIRKSRSQDELDVLQFNKYLRTKMEMVGLDSGLVKRSVNEGFSGGERKRNEILQMSVLDPALAILDEPDSGLDVDAVRLVAKGINAARGADKAIVLITHYQRILNYVVPDVVHIFVNGRIVQSGDKTLATQVENAGYDQFEEIEKTLSSRQ